MQPNLRPLLAPFAKLALVVSCVCCGQPATAQSTNANRFAQQQDATLEELLTNGLKVRTDSEKAFVAKVVKAVEEGKLSESLVKALFQRARDQHNRYPLPYFTAMIQRIAKQRGIDL